MSEPSGDSAPNSNQLQELRENIDRLDRQILGLINQRAQFASEIGRLKSQSGTLVFSPSREEEVLQNVIQGNEGPLPESSIRAIFREIISGSRALQKPIQVAYLGPDYSFSHLAAVERFGQSVQFLRLGTIAAVFEDVARKHADFGVVPLENTTDGRIADSLEMFIRLPQLRICSEIRLRIHHNLLANCDQTQIRKVYSKANALSQCRNWLAKNLPHATLHELPSTAHAAELAQREPEAAAVASRQAAVRYGLNVLFADIEDSPYNETRFAVIGAQDAGRTGNDKTAVMFRTPHAPGALVDALSVFKMHKINLTWVESFPYRGSQPGYVFFVDFEGHQEDTKVRRALTTLQENCESFTVLGSFPLAPVMDS